GAEPGLERDCGREVDLLSRLQAHRVGDTLQAFPCLRVETHPGGEGGRALPCVGGTRTVGWRRAGIRCSRGPLSRCPRLRRWRRPQRVVCARAVLGQVELWLLLLDLDGALRAERDSVGTEEIEIDVDAGHNAGDGERPVLELDARRRGLFLCGPDEALDLRGPLPDVEGLICRSLVR